VHRDDPGLSVYLCFTLTGLVVARADAMPERELLRQVRAAGFHGPLPVDAAIKYLEAIYPDSLAIREAVYYFIASGHAVRTLSVTHPQRRPPRRWLRQRV
jgi:hypothetical protein